MAKPTPLNYALLNFSTLNLTGRVSRQPREPVHIGGFGDTYKGYLARTVENEDLYDDGPPVVVVIKSLRTCFCNDVSIEKVCL